MLPRIMASDPAIQALVWDMALRGVHMQRLLTQFGIIPVVGVHAEDNPEGGKGRRAGTYVPKTRDLEDRSVTMPDGSQRVVTISSSDGAASVKELTETGEPVYIPLDAGRIQPHKDKDAYRWYRYYKLPADYGGQWIGVRHHQDAEDDRRDINRPENLRLIPEGSDDFDRLHVLRPDAESVNSGIDADALFKKRATAKGWRAELVDLLGYARVINAVTLARCRARAPVEKAA